MSGSKSDVRRLRAFNRFYTRMIGLLEEGMHKSPYSLAEARVLYEIGTRGSTNASELGDELMMDRGQLSRLVWRLSDKGLLAVTPDTTDRRANNLVLTREGTEAFVELDVLSEDAAARLLGPLNGETRRRLIDAMQAIRIILGDRHLRGRLVLRDSRPGDLGWLTHRQGALYHAAHGWDAQFEALVARIYADFGMAPDDPPKKLWVAELNGRIAGSVCVVPAEDGEAGVAQLRLLYVEPEARGRGLGHKLVNEAIGFSRTAGYRKLVLWTQDILKPARHIYQAAGFTLVRTEPHRSFGHDLNGEYWELVL